MPRARTDVEQLEELFAESRRRAAARREGRRPCRSGRVGALGRVAALGVVALALVGGVAAKSEAPSAAPQARAATKVDGLRCPIPRELRKPFRAAARESGVALALLVAVAYEESEMKQWARSPKGAIGLMQVLPSTARELGIDVTNARGNLRAGARYLAEMLRRFGDDLDLALAAYNAGPAAVARAGAIPSQETLGYVLGVKARTALLRGCR